MKQRPWPLLTLALAHLLTPVGNILVNSWLLEVNIKNYVEILLLPQNIGHAFVFFIVPIVSAVLIFIFRKWSYYAYICVMMIPFFYSLNSWLEQPKVATGIALILFYAVNIVIVRYFMHSAVRKVYFDARLRWWETKPRYLTDFVGHLMIQGQELTGQVKNISDGGLYLECESQIPLNEMFDLKFKFGEEEYKLAGSAVYKRTSAPAGYGLKLQLNSEMKTQLQKLLKHLEAEGSLVAGRVPGPEDSFAFWFKSLSHSSSAWVPQPPRRGPDKNN